jgi:signal transduction histidine kinase/DNA-binding response OmpR family regulator
MVSNNITDLWMDSQGKLWMGSYSGLGLFDPQTESCVIYDRTDGLASREIEQSTGFISPKGEIFFAGPGGINYFHPDSLKTNEYTPPVVISKILLFENPVLPGKEGKVELEHHENFLTIEFAALNYTNSQKNQYRYRMIGLDPDTVFAGSRRIVSYTDIKPGNYTFWVTGSNNDGVWNPDGTSLDIIIHPPWSKTGLAIALYIILFITGVLGIIRWRTWKLLNDRKILEHQVKQRTRDIEEKDQHILEMDRMKTRFFANISHEFRTPLTLIISPLEEIIRRRKKGDPELKKLGIIHRNSQRLLNLVNQLLDLSKLDSGKLKLELVKTDVVRKLRLTCASFISLAEKNRIRYSCHLPKREYVTYFDAGKLETILINLLSNAFKYTPAGGIIDCYARIEGSHTESNGDLIPVRLSISVIDSGPGIAPEKQKHIFDRFYQGDETHQTEGGGTGIGLSLTKELVELVHGEITVNSEPGEGSCFIVTLPLDKEHLVESEYLIKEEKAGAESQTFATAQQVISSEGSVNEDQEGWALSNRESIHLLIVEDNDDLRAYLREQLQNGYSIVEAATGDKGLKQALKYIPDLIITDVMMPGMNGMDLCRQLKSNERTSHIPVIMLTAKADFDSKISGLQTGADDYILKPFQMEELQTRIANLIRQRNMLRKRFSAQVDTITDDIGLNSYDVNFIRRVTEVVEDHLSDLDFDVRRLQDKSGLSSTQLYRKLHALTGMSPSRFIRRMRLKRAVKLLEQNQNSVTQIAFEVGFGNLSYFTKCFKEQFGISPSEYARQYNQDLSTAAP